MEEQCWVERRRISNSSAVLAQARLPPLPTYWDSSPRSCGAASVRAVNAARRRGRRQGGRRAGLYLPFSTAHTACYMPEPTPLSFAVTVYAHYPCREDGCLVCVSGRPYLHCHRAGPHAYRTPHCTGGKSEDVAATARTQARGRDASGSQRANGRRRTSGGATEEGLWRYQQAISYQNPSIICDEPIIDVIAENRQRL